MKIHWLLIIGMALFATGYSQSLSRLEEKYQRQQAQLSALQNSLDSLKLVLEAHAARIDAEKDRPNADRQKIARLMAEGLEISREINRREATLRKFQQEMGSTRLQLVHRYGERLDSLHQALNGVSSPVRQQFLLQRYLALMMKYVRVSPAFQTLAFNPQRLKSLEPGGDSDSLQHVIYREILTNAAAEIDSHLVLIEKTTDEMENLIRLEEKHREFLEEAESEAYPGSFAPGLIPGRSSGYTANADNPERITTATDKFSATNSPGSIFQQLGIGISPALSETGGVPASNPSLTPREFLNLLKAARQQLRYLRQIVDEKLSEEPGISPPPNQQP